MNKIDERLNFLRAASTVLVICVHIANYYCRAVASISRFSYLSALALNVLARVSVPVFFMISGAPLLSKPYSREKNKKRIVKRLISLAGITAVFLLWDKYFMGRNVKFGPGILDSPQRALLWFMYALLGLYLALPFIKILADGMGPREDALFLILWLLLNGLKKYGVMRTYPVPLLSGTYYLGYFMAGHIIVKYKDKIDYRKKTPILAALFLARRGGAFVISRRHYLETGRYWQNLLTYSNFFSMTASLCAFTLGYTLVSEKFARGGVVRTISDLSFGIYLLHGMALDAFLKVFPYKEIPCLFGAPVILVAVLSVTAGAVRLLHKIKFLKGYL